MKIISNYMSSSGQEISHIHRFSSCRWAQQKFSMILADYAHVETGLDLFILNLGYSIPPKNAPPLDTRVSESPSHIQTHLILNITIACCFPHPGSVTCTFGRNTRAGGMAHDHNAYYCASRLPLPILSF